MKFINYKAKTNAFKNLRNNFAIACFVTLLGIK